MKINVLHYWPSVNSYGVGGLEPSRKQRPALPCRYRCADWEGHQQRAAYFQDITSTATGHGTFDRTLNMALNTKKYTMLLDYITLFVK
jgi:hypothetical protein